MNFAKFLRTPFLTEHLWATGSVICNSYFLAIAKLLQSSHFLRIESYLRYLLFGEAIFLAKELFRIKISIEELLVQTGTSAQHQLFQGSNILEKANFSKSNIQGYVLFLESYFFRVCIFQVRFIAAAFA